ncbi:peptidoglycan DD-metalloendopeptidase family protein [Candidatus Venteria ishoeyi]|uniref:Murein DD-endopeptidase MepM n=1 Tax=Candidatus Venteria ishoeyi TaxID=1899563 RepID=A0A1H6F481_9GAMM|nr:peptidoglycan DD-metalloendopeptidase family protein [Candidatus Venteria ishoeyi]SEH04967.1 Murein DD-endopeptidase MepM [Candidatus Venteria ishoeyi]
MVFRFFFIKKNAAYPPSPFLDYQERGLAHFEAASSHKIHRSKFITLSISVVGLSLAWWLNHSSASFTPAQELPPSINLTKAKPEPVQTSATPIASAASIASAPHTTILSQPKPIVVSAIPEIKQALNVESPIKDRWLELTIRSGDSLSKLFSQHKLNRKDLHKILQLKQHRKVFRSLRLGQKIQILHTADGHIQQLKLHSGPVHCLVIKASNENGKFIGTIEELALETRQKTASGQIQSSFFGSARKAGLSSAQVLALMKIFSWDIDFALDIRSGDRFNVVFEELHHQGKKVKTGAILAAEFINNGQVFRALRYQAADGSSTYYTPAGNSLQKAFIRTPVKVGRVTSHFNPNRRHPVLNRIRAHKGVDYGAPVGTPIYAAGNGRVKFIGRKGGYGNAIILQHAQKYTTLYGHMNAFAKGMKSGQRVKQGQLIGYVGKTGLASGPHLHYEFRVNGVHKNPLTVKLPKSLPMDKGFVKDFQQQTQAVLAQLNALGSVALNTASALSVE